MNLGGKLFVKVFIGFWLATVAVLASWLVAAHYFESLPGTGLRHPSPGPPPQFLLRLHYNLENLPLDELPDLVATTEREHGIAIYLIDRSDVDLFDRELPEGVLAVAQSLRGPTRRAQSATRRARLVAHDVYRGELGHLRAVVVIPNRHAPLMRLLGDNPWLQVTLAVLISGLICYLLSRLLTGRLKQLQLASRRLATGDLDVRIEVRDSGGDETDELARDFNTMAEQLQERIGAQKRLLSDVSHELRSPLARLRIALALAQEDRDNNEQYLQRIEVDAERLEDLIGQLLSTQGAAPELDCHIDLVALLQQLCDDADFEARAVGLRVVFESALDQAVVASRGDLLRKSFDNILSNALNYSPADTTIRVKLAQLAGGFEIRVEDRGPGVAESELTRIFDSFYRADGARARDTGGFGLGLSIAQRGITLHDGKIRAENSSPGLAIIVFLPGLAEGC